MSTVLLKRKPLDASKIENLAFKGGSVKGIAYVGALGALEDIFSQKKLIFRNRIKKVAGTSAGAITALLIALNHSLDEIIDYLVNTDLKSFLPEKESRVSPSNLFNLEGQGPVTQSTMLAGALMDIHNRFGLYSGNQFLEWLETIIKQKTNIDQCTFAELHQLILTDKEKKLCFKDIYVIGFNLSCNITKIFNYIDTPDTVISDAIRISMSIPIVFLPHCNYVKTPSSTPGTPADETDGGGQDKAKSKEAKKIKRKALNEDLWVDGGLTENYPVRVFDTPNFNDRTIGFYFVSPEELAVFEGHAKGADSIGPRREIKSGFDYARALFESVIDSQQVSNHVNSRDPERTIYINHLNTNSLNFGLTVDEKQSLVNAGWDAVYKRFGIPDDKIPPCKVSLAEYNEKIATAAAAELESSDKGNGGMQLKERCLIV